MLNWKLINWTIAICFVGLNVLGIGLSHHRRQAEAASQRSKIELRNRQADQLAVWHGAPTLAFGDSACLDAIRQLGPAEELEPLGNVLGWDNLSASEADDLAKAIHGLMQAYRRDGAQHVIKYMHSRDEALGEAEIKQLRDYLVNRHGLDEEELVRMSLKDQFLLYWDALDATTSWKAFVPEHCGIRIWQSDAVTPEFVSDVSTLSDVDMDLWQFRSHRYHNFTHATDTLSSHIAKRGGVQVADLRLVIEHAGKGVHTICPYVVRFWYSTEREKWIPHLLAVYATSRDIPTSLLF